MIAPASDSLAREFGITSTVVIALTTSIFVLAYAIGPLFLGPLSEIFGRSRVLQWANLWYLVWNLACGFSRNKDQLITFRFLAGIGGSAPMSIGGGVIGDCWKAEQRGQAIAIYSLAPLFGPVIGPLCGAWCITTHTSYR
jgi:MFS family permease